MTHIVKAATSFVLLIVLAAVLGACNPIAIQPSQQSLEQPSKPRPEATISMQACPSSIPCPACPVCLPAKPAPSEATYKEAAWREIPAWGQSALLPSFRAFLKGCESSQARTPWQKPCAAARTIPSTEPAARAFFETNFSAFQIVANDGQTEGLVTGYYEPILKGRRQPEGAFRHPVYGVPADLVTVDLTELHPELQGLRLRGRLEGRRVVPYHPRSQIEAKGQALPARPLAWVADPIELFFLQIQGSGQIEVASGERFRLGYADQNGHPYRSLGRHLIDRGELVQDQASMQGIKAWAAAHPSKLQEALNTNPSYVFFRELPPPRHPLDGPPGSLGVPLTAGYSAAVDPRYVPLGSPIFLQTTYPLSPKPLERLMVAQDTGGAIRGAIRADFFWGTGEEAGNQAGRMRQQGRLWLLWPRGEPLPRQQ